MPRHTSDSGLQDAALRERVKELECLYAIARISADEGASLPDALQRVARIVPQALRFPSVAQVGIQFDNDVYGSLSAAPGRPVSCSILVHGRPRGIVAVGYARGAAGERRSRILKEERRLLAAVSRQIAHIAEKIEARQAQVALQGQLRHADRLATTGQLASGVAHELNEPLGSILGFTQLLAKTANLTEAARADLKKIEGAALHARGIIRKLMLFARQTSPTYVAVHLNDLMEESAGLLLWRCEDNGITVVRQLEEGLPVIEADEGQLRQVMINLIMNAIQAMPNRGLLTLGTAGSSDGVEISVADTGEGMTPAMQQRIFDPFFTTKDIDRGTGLGLSIVHGIVADHGGRIAVDSELGRGSCFRVWLPTRPAARNGVFEKATDVNTDERANTGCR